MMRHQCRYALLFICFISLLSGCTLFSPVKTTSETKYVLNANPKPVTKKSKHPLSLLVTPMTTTAMYNTSGMAYTMGHYELNYFSKNQWAEPPASMLQLLIVQTLQRTHYFNAVNAFTSIGHDDVALNTQLIQLQQEFFSQSSIVHLVVRAQLVNLNTHQTIATQQFSIHEYAPQNTPYGGVVATNQASAKLLKQLAVFCLKML